MNHDFLTRNYAVIELKWCAQISQENQAPFWPRKNFLFPHGSNDYTSSSWPGCSISALSEICSPSLPLEFDKCFGFRGMCSAGKASNFRWHLKISFAWAGGKRLQTFFNHSQLQNVRGISVRRLSKQLGLKASRVIATSPPACVKTEKSWNVVIEILSKQICFSVSSSSYTPHSSPFP